MPKPVTVRAVKPFDYNGRMVNTGSDLEMPPLDAAVHARKGNVSLTKYQNRSMQADDAPPTRRRRGNYRRRDMTAEQP